MKKIYSYATLFFAFAFLSFTKANTQTVQPGQQTGAIPINANDVFDVESTIYNSCTGEEVHFSGKVHLNLHGTMNANKVTTFFHFNAQNVIGTGLTTGNVYTGSQNETYIDNHPLVGDKITYAYAYKYKMVTSGKQNNLVMIENFHVTINADGTGTVIRGDNFIECH